MKALSINNLGLKLGAIFAITALYAFTRYNIFGGVSFVNIPVYTANKAIAFSAVFTMLLAAVGHLKSNKTMAHDWGIVSFHLAAVHIIVSLIIQSKAYYPYMFGEDKMNLKGELTMMFGYLSAYCYFRLFRSQGGSKEMGIFKLLATAFIALHIGVYAFASWLQPMKWNGGMPPISLITFLMAGLAFLLYMNRKDRA